MFGKILSNKEINQISEASYRILEKTGFHLPYQEALETLDEKGAEVDFKKEIVRVPKPLMKQAIENTPNKIKIYDRSGNNCRELGGEEVFFRPGSAPTKMLDYDGKTRKATAEDVKNVSLIADALEHYKFISTPLPMDVPESAQGWYAPYLMVKNCTNPLNRGSMGEEKGFEYMQKIFEAARGGREELIEKPLDLYIACPTSPLSWSKSNAKFITKCAENQMPISIISAPQLGTTAPATLAGLLTQHNAEVLSGVLVTQLVRKGTPVTYGGSTIVMDMRHGTSSLGSMEAMLLTAGCSCLAQHYELPHIDYVGPSDSLTTDAQSALEAAMGIFIGSLSKVDIITGPGLLEEENCTSLEKLVIDHEICRMSLRGLKGITVDEERIAEDVIREIGPNGLFLKHKHTLDWHKKDIELPDEIVNRENRSQWEKKGSKTMQDKANEKVKRIIKDHKPEEIPSDIKKDIDNAAEEIMKEQGIGSLPLGPK
ncbi:hypothetical protein AKJ50_01020 [candidate division MSBL1 archaeon SCGC-AAA382A13]|uniref:Trimethylamine methyltransferase n=1 Tax=candidate division MSBL1 archaeon SCGC-AAA382A13 TaxID=1698279 RepID=A0A133VG53_9EURY|nr:hypothetical protein AKJ50_01020 [candidate division MSBL1 archaeon SCGC-AAA382A13]